MIIQFNLVKRKTFQQEATKHINTKKTFKIVKVEQNPGEMKTKECPRLSESRLQQWRRKLMKKAQWLVWRSLSVLLVM